MKRTVCGVFCLLLVGQIAQAQQGSRLTPLNNVQILSPGGPIKGLKPANTGGAVKGIVQVAVKLQDPPLVVVAGVNAKQLGIAMSDNQQRAYLAAIKQKQDAVMSQIAAMGGTELGRVSKGHNALMVSIDASHIADIHGVEGVVAVRPVADYIISATSDPTLAITNAYIGATSVQNGGVTGAGVRVAMLDTGIDYTHYNLGGSGNVADYNAAKAAAAATPPPALFPTSKVIGGFDFTGEVWPNGPLAPDANPLDLNGHGSLTADSLGGASKDGLHKGVAPGTALYAVKVCSSVSTSCSGVAILEGIDFALDPSNTGTLDDAVDLISMSIGGDFGQREDDAGEMFTDVVNFGVVSVISAGNSGDIPYILGHPASTPEVLSVAATSAVNAFGIPLVVNSPASIAGTYSNTATLDFAPVNSTVTADIVYVGRACPANGATPADPLLANPSGKIALVDRGTCAISLKVDYVANSGAVGVLVGLVAPGDAVSFSNGGGSDFVPSLVITQSTANTLKSALTSTNVNGTISLNNAISLASNVASFSSRGPNYSYNMLKPDISAPGTINGALVGSGTGQVTESGTSFSCPLTGGSAALLLSKNRSLGPLDIKAILMETSEPSVFANAATMPGVLAPMSRMGAGEVRVDRAAAGTTAVWDSSAPLAVSVSFGTYRLNAPQSFKKKIVVRNYSMTARTYTIGNTYRDAPNTTGVTLAVPASISVPANSSASFAMSLSVAPASLPVWTLNGGSQGSNGELLNAVEYAGYLTLASGAEKVHIPWHILPHKAANVMPTASTIALNGNPVPATVTNASGAVGGAVSIFSLTGTGTQFPASVLPAPGDDFAVINLQSVGVRLVCISNPCSSAGNFGVQFAITTFGQRSHPDVPAEFDVLLDLNNDGTPDLDIFNADIGLETTGTDSGQNGVFIADLAAGTASGPFFFSIADLDSANMIFTAPLSALVSSTGPALGLATPFTFSVLAFDNYYTGNLTDKIGPMKYELDMPQFYPALADFSAAPNAATPNLVIPNNAANPYFTGPYNGNSPSQTGLLLMYTDGKNARESDRVTVTP
jgi:subtilisin family serine protease